MSAISHLKPAVFPDTTRSRLLHRLRCHADQRCLGPAPSRNTRLGHNPGEELATVYSDTYKLGLLALRLLAGDHDTKAPSTCRRAHQICCGRSLPTRLPTRHRAAHCPKRGPMSWAMRSKKPSIEGKQQGQPLRRPASHSIRRRYPSSVPDRQHPADPPYQRPRHQLNRCRQVLILLPCPALILRLRFAARSGSQSRSRSSPSQRSSGSTPWQNRTTRAHPKSLPLHRIHNQPCSRHRTRPQSHNPRHLRRRPLPRISTSEPNGDDLYGHGRASHLPGMHPG